MAGTNEFATDMQYGGFWLRSVAYIIDGLITFVISFTVSLMLGASIGYIMVRSGAGGIEAIELIVYLAAGVAGLFIGVVYFAAFESSTMQATPGKKALGLKVTDENGNRISFGRAVGRYLAKILSLITLFIGFMMVGWTKKKQGLHDMIAGTLVIRN